MLRARSAVTVRIGVTGFHVVVMGVHWEVWRSAKDISSRLKFSVQSSERILKLMVPPNMSALKSALTSPRTPVILKESVQDSNTDAIILPVIVALASAAALPVIAKPKPMLPVSCGQSTGRGLLFSLNLKKALRFPLMSSWTYTFAPTSPMMGTGTVRS